jgi:lysophospholipase L1-like esterase
MRSLLLGVALCAACLLQGSENPEPAHFPFRENDRVAWIGSSSTRIGTWCRTMEFLLCTRHPELHLTFNRSTTGGGTFATGIKNIPAWTSDFKPTYVLFNYGGNDAGGGTKGISQFEANMEKCLEMAQELGARSEFVTHQSGDVRVTAQQPFDNRKLYAELMITYAGENNWTIYDVHHPLEFLQLLAQKQIPDFTINKDRIHLTDSAYVAWGFYLYEDMNPPVKESRVELSADGKITNENNCRVSEVLTVDGALEFTRSDDVLPLLPPDPIPSGNALKTVVNTTVSALGTAIKDTLHNRDAEKFSSLQHIPSDPIQVTSTQPADTLPPDTAAQVQPAPGVKKPVEVAKSKDDSPAKAAVKETVSNVVAPAKAPAPAPFKIPPAQAAYAAKYGQQLPPRALVPMEKFSRYMLKITGLETGRYQITCEGKPVGIATSQQLAKGVNLNSVLLDSKNPAPWADLARDIWIGKRLDEIGKTNWKFRIEKK